MAPARGRMPPALRLKSGDRVLTSTLDDQGADASGRVVAPGPYPQTGPFFVEGAEPGDLLVITLDRVAPNRATGASVSHLAPGAVPAGTIGGRPDPTRFPWTIDAARGVVELDLKTAMPRCPGASRFTATTMEMPLRPARSARSAGARHGGEPGVGRVRSGGRQHGVRQPGVRLARDVDGAAGRWAPVPGPRACAVRATGTSAAPASRTSLDVAVQRRSGEEEGVAAQQRHAAVHGGRRVRDELAARGDGRRPDGRGQRYDAAARDAARDARAAPLAR